MIAKVRRRATSWGTDIGSRLARRVGAKRADFYRISGKKATLMDRQIRGLVPDWGVLALFKATACRSGSGTPRGAGACSLPSRSAGGSEKRMEYWNYAFGWIYTPLVTVGDTD